MRVLLLATSVGVSLNGAHGTHRESDGTVTAPLVPVPIVSASYRNGCYEVAAEGLPPIGPIHIADNGLGMHDIALTYADASVRYWNRSGTLALGIGETLYNQRTTFGRAFDSNTTHVTELDRSRVAGTRYEIAGRLPVGKDDEVRATLGIDPAMHGRYAYTDTIENAAFTSIFSSRSSWERASQVDADVRMVHRFGDYALSYGMRYLNYTAAYTAWIHPRFADANSILMPYVGVQRFFGGESLNAKTPVPGPCLSRASLPDIDFFAGANLSSASHSDASGIASRAAHALPQIALRARRGPYEMFFDDVPWAASMSGTVPHTRRVPFDLHAAYADGGLRYWMRDGHTAFGVGDALYFSRSRTGRGPVRALRAAGLRYEAVEAVPFGLGRRLVFDLAVAPRMHQRTTEWAPGYAIAFSPQYGTGSLVDASLSFEATAGSRHTWVYGLRYLNYAGGVHGPPFDYLKERTSIVSPFAQWGTRLGP